MEAQTHRIDDGVQPELVVSEEEFSRENDGKFHGSEVLTNGCGEGRENASTENEGLLEVEKREVHVEDVAVESQKRNQTEKVSVEKKMNGQVVMIQPHSQLPKPEAPPGLLKSLSSGEEFSKFDRSLSENLTVDVPAIGKFIRERSTSLSSALVRSWSYLSYDRKPNVTEFNLSGLKVTVEPKNEESKELTLKGRISFFSKSNCRDCAAVRSFFREKGLKFVEINIDVYPIRAIELKNRTGSVSVPQIFFNEKLLGGLVALNSLRNSGLFEQKLKEMVGRKCPEDAPAAPVYGFDDPEEERTDEMVGIVRVSRQRLPIQDRLLKMKIVKNCFAGSEMVDVIIQQLDCGRKKAVEIGRELARKHFIHHVFGESEFEDGNSFYRFLEHEPFIPRCYNFRGLTNDTEPKPAAVVGERLTKIMFAILESYVSEDRRHVNYQGISNSEEFRRYINVAQDLQRLNPLELSSNEKLAFFLNLYNAMVIHAVIRVGRPEAVIDRKSFFIDFQYIVGGQPYSLTAIKNGILRNNQRAPYSFMRPFSSGDKRLELAVPKVNKLIHFGLCNGTRSSPMVRFFSPQGIDSELRTAAREFFQMGGIDFDLDKRTVYLTRTIKWFDVDFGQDKDVLKWIMNYLDATKTGLLTHLLSDGGPINIVYHNYNWSVNS